MRRQVYAVLLSLVCTVPASVICAGSPQIAPAAGQPDVYDAPQVVDRVSDSYTLDAYVWRDSSPLTITGRWQALHNRRKSLVGGADKVC